MRFSTIFSIVSLVSAGTVPNDVVTDLLSKADQIQKLFNFNVLEKSKFTPEDLSKVLPSLMNSDNIKDLLVNNKVSFSLKDLSIPEKEADKIIVDAIVGTKAMAKVYIKSYIAKKTDAKAIEGTLKEFRAIIEELSKNEEMVEKVIEKVDALFTQHPELASVIRSIFAAMPEVFDKEMIDFFNLFLTEVKSTHPELIVKLNQLVDLAQTKYNLLPEPQLKHLKAALASFE